MGQNMSIQNSEIGDYVYPRVINWGDIMEDIATNGMTYSDVSKCLGIAGATIQGWRTGSEPRHSSGGALLLVHARICGRELTKLRVAEAGFK